MENRATKAGFKWDKDGFGVRPDLIRFSKAPFETEYLEIEFLMYGQQVGRTWDVAGYDVQNWLQCRSIKVTPTLAEAIDMGWSNGDSVYFVEDDRYFDATEERHISEVLPNY